MFSLLVEHPFIHNIIAKMVEQINEINSGSFIFL